MPKMSTETRHRLTGPTMGSHWVVEFYGPADCNLIGLHAALQAAVDEVDSQMSTWNPDSALMRLNASPCDCWILQPKALFEVLQAGVGISALTGGAFEMNLGDVTRAWGFGAGPISLEAIRAASARPPQSAKDVLEFDAANLAIRKRGETALDLSGIAKGYGVDCLAQVMKDEGLTHALCSIDGEVRALAAPPDAAGWAVALEQPDPNRRAAHSVVELADGAIATSGDYRHFVTVRGQVLSHTADPRRRAPLVAAPASVSVMGQSCMVADALATALMVMGADEGQRFARKQGISALILRRKDGELESLPTGRFADA